MNTVDFVMEQLVVAEALIVETDYRSAALLLRELIDRMLEEVESLTDQRNALEEVVWHHSVDGETS